MRLKKRSYWQLSTTVGCWAQVENSKGRNQLNLVKNSINSHQKGWAFSLLLVPSPRPDNSSSFHDGVGQSRGPVVSVGPVDPVAMVNHSKRQTAFDWWAVCLSVCFLNVSKFRLFWIYTVCEWRQIPIELAVFLANLFVFRSPTTTNDWVKFWHVFPNWCTKSVTTLNTISYNLQYCLMVMLSSGPIHSLSVTAYPALKLLAAGGGWDIADCSMCQVGGVVISFVTCLNYK